MTAGCGSCGKAAPPELAITSGDLDPPPDAGRFVVRGSDTGEPQAFTAYVDAVQFQKQHGGHLAAR